MARKIIRIATRKSALALWQAHYVQQLLQKHHSTLQVEIISMVTHGDIILNMPLAKIGGKALFVKELEHALLEERADIAVHSMKDIPALLPAGLGLGAICMRDDPRDAFVSERYFHLDQLPVGGVIGTSSRRRECQLRKQRPDLIVRDLRGNVDTRLAKLESQKYDAIILAAAGLKRLGYAERICYAMSPETSLPAAGQGAIGIECRWNDSTVRKLIAPLNHHATELRICAERALNKRLGGGCHVPIGSYAELEGDNLWLRAFVGTPDGRHVIYGERRGQALCAEKIGISLADELFSSGADEILATLT